jgi:hypothetical protein
LATTAFSELTAVLQPHGKAWGRLVIIGPDGRRHIGRLTCERVAWLDNNRLAYGVDEEVMEIPADGSRGPRRLLVRATNPNRVQ